MSCIICINKQKTAYQRRIIDWTSAVCSSDLAPGEEEFYHADLIGLRVEDVAGQRLGTVRTVENHGAGDLLEIEGLDGRMLLLPFTRAAVPLVDLAGGRLVAEPPAEVEVPGGPGEPELG